MKKYYQLSIVASLFLAQCSHDKNNIATVARNSVNDLTDTTEQINEKLNMDEAIKKFGTPYKRDSFDMSLGLSEFRIGLYNYIDKRDYLHKPFLIHELTWKTGKESLTTIWYKNENGKWVPVDMLLYTKNQYF